MLLAVDIGNSHTVIGVIENDRARNTFRITTDRQKTDWEYALVLGGLSGAMGVERDSVEGAIISSVVPETTSNVARAIELTFGVKPLVVGKGVKTGVNILIDDPATAGADLIVAAAGALKLYAPPIIVFDLGTATTVMALDAKGSFRGGAIMPGVRLSLNALSGGTSQLPFIDLDSPKKCIGTNTVDCMKSGSIYGNAAMMDGMIDRFEAELGSKTTVIATGGLAPSVAKYCFHDIIIEDDLIFTGLIAIWNRNR